MFVFSSGLRFSFRALEGHFRPFPHSWFGNEMVFQSQMGTPSNPWGDLLLPLPSHLRSGHNWKSDLALNLTDVFEYQFGKGVFNIKDEERCHV